VIFAPIVDAPANATVDETVRYSDAANKLMMSMPESAYTFQVSFPNTGFGGLVVKPWSDRKRTIYRILPEVQQKLAKLPGVTMFPVLPPALPGGGTFPVEVVISSTADTPRILDFAQQLQARVMKSGKFMLLNIDTKFDQPQTNFAIDRDKVAALGLNLE